MSSGIVSSSEPCGSMRGSGSGMGGLPLVSSSTDYYDLEAQSSQRGSCTGIMDKADNKPDDKADVKLTDVKDALTNASSILRLLYFAAITYFTGLLVQRPILPKPELFPSARLYHDMVAEMVLAFVIVSFLQFGIIIHDFIVTARPKMSFRLGWIAPMGLWAFSMSWMVTYTIHIPLVYQRSWQWTLTGTLIAINFVVSVSLKLWVDRKTLIQAS